MSKKNWYPLDNAAKIYPPNTTTESPFVFSFSARIDEEVDPELLEKALNSQLQKMPTFKTSLKRGFFWYYLESNPRPAICQPQPANYLRKIDPEVTNGYMFEVFYRKNIITVNFHHCLTDGTGGVNFFLELLFNYFILRGDDVESEGVIRPSASPHFLDEAEDTFRVFDKKKAKISLFEKDAFRFKGRPYDYDGCGIIVGECSVDELKCAAKKYDATITEYLTAQYMISIYESWLKGKPVKNKDVKILVPVNLRTRFNSKTMRNFTLYVRCKHDFHEEISFEECIALCKNQFKEGLETERIEKMIHSNVKIEKNFLMKLVPLFLKDIALKISYMHVGENLQSGDISNIGLIKTPECFNGRLKDITFVIGPTKSAQQNLGVIGYNGKIYVTSARGYVENDIERNLFRRIAADGVNFTLSSNYWEAEL